jgi:hypothetical protein
MFRARLRDRRRRIRVPQLFRIRQRKTRHGRAMPRPRIRQHSGVRLARLPQKRQNKRRGLQLKASLLSTPASRRQNAALQHHMQALQNHQLSTLPLRRDRQLNMLLRLRDRQQSTPRLRRIRQLSALLPRHNTASRRKRSLVKNYPLAFG